MQERDSQHKIEAVKHELESAFTKGYFVAWTEVDERFLDKMLVDQPLRMVSDLIRELTQKQNDEIKQALVLFTPKEFADLLTEFVTKRYDKLILSADDPAIINQAKQSAIMYIDLWLKKNPSAVDLRDLDYIERSETF